MCVKIMCALPQVSQDSGTQTVPAHSSALTPASTVCAAFSDWHRLAGAKTGTVAHAALTASLYVRNLPPSKLSAIEVLNVASASATSATSVHNRSTWRIERPEQTCTHQVCLMDAHTHCLTTQSPPRKSS
jgi:hypothetical protein